VYPQIGLLYNFCNCLGMINFNQKMLIFRDISALFESIRNGGLTQKVALSDEKLADFCDLKAYT
jgi:hypothetical protein